MQDDIKDTIAFLAKEDMSLLNKAELARRYNCDPRTIDRYLKIQSGELVPKSSSRAYHSKLDYQKPTENLLFSKRSASNPFLNSLPIPLLYVILVTSGINNYSLVITAIAQGIRPSTT